MGFFGNTKDSAEQLQTDEVRQASSFQPQQSSIGEDLTFPSQQNAQDLNSQQQVQQGNNYMDAYQGDNSFSDSGKVGDIQPDFGQEGQSNPFALQGSGQGPGQGAAGGNDPFAIDTPESSLDNNPFDNHGYSSGGAQGGLQGGFGSDSQREMIQEMIDETIEKIIEERWQSITDDVGKVVKWKDDIEEQFVSIRDDMSEIRDVFQRLEKKVFNKINDYDKSILDVNSEIKAMEKVFQKITPTLVNNINELSRITTVLKKADIDVGHDKFGDDSSQNNPKRNW